MGIQALPDTTVRALGANQVLTDPASLVKELIDNALDANATTIAVEIHSNTVDSIQVRDNGHGIAPEDRPLVARRYCTSKLSHDDQLSSVSASSLGFRGEALAAAAELSGSLTISTRIEGEQVAVALKIDSKGEVVLQEKASLPVGTTARVTDFIKANPVRRQLALKNSDSCLKKIKRTLQSYAFARPHVRLSIRVLKAKTNNKIDWVYAPKLNGNVEDAAFKVVGAACASQCTWSVMESDGFSLQAFLPRPDAEPNKISNISAFISLDGRPVSASKGAFKDICKAYRTALKRASAPFQDTKDPFLYLDITGSPGSYDANAEPAKDDVVFEDRNVVINVSKKLFEAVYSPAEDNRLSRLGTADLPRMQLQQDLDNHIVSSLRFVDTHLHVPDHNPGVSEHVRANASIDDHDAGETERQDDAELQHGQARFRSNMYGCDEEDLELLRAQPTTDFDEADPGELHQARHDITISNPWITAKMNAPTRRSQVIDDDLPPRHAPAAIMSSSPIKARPQVDANSGMLLTPRPSSPSPPITDDVAGRMTCLLSGGRARCRSPSLPPPQMYAQVNSSSPNMSDRLIDGTSSAQEREQQLPHGRHTADGSAPAAGLSLQEIPDASVRPRARPKKQQISSNVNKPFAPPTMQRPEKVWFDHLEDVERTRAYRTPRQSQNAVANNSSHRGLVVQGELGDLTEEPRPLTPPRRNRDIREFVGSGSSQSRPPVQAPRQLVDRGRDFENSGPETLDLVEDVAPHRPQAGFVTASKFMELEESPAQDDEPVRRPPKRRKTSERRALQELSASAPLLNTGNGPSEDEEYRPDASNRATSKRKASRKLSRRETLKLPLEKTPAGQGTHTLAFTLSTSAQDIAAAAGNFDKQSTFIGFNEPALPSSKGIDNASSHMLSLAADLHKLLIKAGADVDAPGPGRLLAELKTAFATRAEHIDREEEEEEILPI